MVIEMDPNLFRRLGSALAELQAVISELHFRHDVRLQEIEKRLSGKSITFNADEIRGQTIELKK